MKSLFPEMEREISDDRKAARREQVQQARHFLKGRDLNWLINHLLEKGPMTEHVMMIAAMAEEYHGKDACRRGFDVFRDLYALWLVKKLWRQKRGFHPGSGEESYLYGVRGVHAPNA